MTIDGLKELQNVAHITIEDVKRPDTRWKDDIEKFAGKTWQRIAQDRQLWKELGEAYV